MYIVHREHNNTEKCQHFLLICTNENRKWHDEKSIYVENSTHITQPTHTKNLRRTNSEINNIDQTLINEKKSQPATLNEIIQTKKKPPQTNKQINGEKNENNMKDYTVIMWLLLSEFRLFIRKPFGIRRVFVFYNIFFFGFFLSQMMNKSKEKSSILLLLIKNDSTSWNNDFSNQSAFGECLMECNFMVVVLQFIFSTVLYNFGLSFINNPTKKTKHF